eukprot:3999062-Prymnesium_polylepis.2
MTAPASHKVIAQRIEQQSQRLPRAAAYSGVAPGLIDVMVCSMSAPACTNSSVHKGWDIRQLMKSGDLPWVSACPRSAPASISSSAISASPRETHAISAVSSTEPKRRSRLAPARSRTPAHCARPDIAENMRGETDVPSGHGTEASMSTPLASSISTKASSFSWSARPSAASLARVVGIASKQVGLLRVWSKRAAGLLENFG